MKKLFQQYRQILGFLLVVLLAFLLRFWRYEYFPVGGETADEYAWTLLGASLIQERVPASWSFFEVYEQYHYVEGVYDAPIVRPVLDHPPLFSLIPGLAHSLQSNWLEAPSLKIIRLPMVLLGALNAGLFWLVAKRFFTEKHWQWLAMALFITIPTLVFGSRLVAAENALTTLVLLAMLVITDKRQAWTSKALTAISAAAVLIKVAGVIIPAVLVAYGLLTKQKAYVRPAIIGGLIGAAVFALYGAWYNWPLFLAVIFEQSSRNLGLVTLQNRLFFNPAVVRHVLFDGWKIVGVFSTFAWLAWQTEKKQQKFWFVHLFTILGFAFITMVAGEDTIHGWYDYLLWPGLILSITAFLQKIYQTANGALFGLVWLLLLPVIRLWLSFISRYEGLSNMEVRLLIGLGFVPLLLQVMHKKQWTQKAIVVLLCTFLLVNIASVLTITQETYWSQAAVFQDLL